MMISRCRKRGPTPMKRYSERSRVVALVVLAFGLVPLVARAADPPARSFGLSADVHRQAERTISKANQLQEDAYSEQVTAAGLSGMYRERALQIVDEALKEAAGYPQLWVAKAQILEDLGRLKDACAAQVVACRLATEGGVDDDFARDCQIRLASLYRDEGDAVRAAEVFLSLFVRTPDYAWQYDMFRPSFRLPVIGKRRGNLVNHYRAVPSTPSPMGQALEKIWGPMSRFFTDYAMPSDPKELLHRAEGLKSGMDYKDVVRRVGFPVTNRMDEHAEGGVTCWHYNYEVSTLKEVGDDLVKLSAVKGEVELHVLLRNGKVVRVVTAQPRRDERRP
jgi:hypothetical protein